MPLPSFKYFADRRLLVLIALSLISYFVNLGRAPIYILDEAKNAQCAREMLQDNNWIVPTFNGQIRTDKPPLHYFAMALAYKVAGATPYAARFFSAVCGLLLIIITYRFVLLYAESNIAFLTGFILLCSWHLTFEMRLAVPDPYLILILTAAFYSFFIYHTSQAKANRYIYFFYVLLGLGVLSKGPVAVLIPGIAIIAFLIIEKQLTLTAINRYKLIQGLVILLLISLPWYLLAHYRTHGEWTREFFVKNNFKRFVKVKEKHGGLFLMSLGYIFIGMMPVTFFATGITKYVRREFKVNSLIRYASVIVLTVLVFFSISHTQLPNYTIPCYPFLAIVAAYYFNQTIGNQHLPVVGIWLLFALCIALPVAVYIFSQLDVSLSKLPYLWVTFLFIPAGMLYTLISYYTGEKRNEPLLRTFSTVMLTFLATSWLLSWYIFPKVFSSNPVADGIKIHKLHEPLVAFHIYNPAFNFYLQQPVKRIEDINELARYIHTHPNCKVLTRAKNLKQLGEAKLNLKLYFMQRDNFESNTTCLLEQK